MLTNRPTNPPADRDDRDVRGETPTPPEETPKERVDRELMELANELRILLPGVQIIFAFLLTAPFSAAFQDISDTERAAYLVALATAAIASILLMGPVAHHRLRFRRGDKENLVRSGNRQALAALASIGVSLAAASYLVVSFVFSPAAGGVAAGLVVVLATYQWWIRVPS